jgi:hypothetical protein
MEQKIEKNNFCSEKVLEHFGYVKDHVIGHSQVWYLKQDNVVICLLRDLYTGFIKEIVPNYN